MSRALRGVWDGYNALVTPAPPRRPRRWWMVLVQSAICVVLAAMVAWPERVMGADIIWGEAGTEAHDEMARMHWSIAQRVRPRRTRFIDAHNRRDARHVIFIDEEESGGAKRVACRCPRCPNMPGFWIYRDAGLHVLLGDLFE